MSKSKLGLAVVGLVVLVPLLTGCDPKVPDPTPTVASSSTPTATPTPTPTEEPQSAPSFGLPTNCDALIGPTLAAKFASRNIVLFDSSAGGGIYPGGNAPHQGTGNPLFCLYGQDMVDLSSFQIDAQPQTAADWENRFAGFEGFGGDVVESADGTVVTFTLVGNEMGEPAEIHVLRPGSFLTAWSAFGGEQQVARLTGYLDAIAAHNGLG